MRIVTTAYPLLDSQSVALLSAITGDHQKSLDGYWTWRKSTVLSDADARSYIALPLLLDMLQREGIEDPDLPRIKGVVRQIWASNVLKLRILFAALEALRAGGVEPLLIKGAALFTRSPDLIGKRAAGDYDLLIPNGRMAEAVELLARGGFTPVSLAWDDFNDDLYASISAGMPISHPEFAGEIDIHWRPLWNSHRPQLTDELFRDSSRLTLHGRQVNAIAVSDHIFMAVARCEPWDRVECFARILEVYLLLTTPSCAVDWSHLSARCRIHGHRAVAVWFFRALEEATGVAAPSAFLTPLKDSVSHAERADLSIRAKAPWDRSDEDNAALARADFQWERTSPVCPSPQTENEVRLREGDPQRGMRQLWEYAVARVRTAPSARVGYLEGFSFPEALGRWTSSRWSILTVPLDPAGGDSQKLYLQGSALGSGPERRWVYACAGGGVFKRLLVRGESLVSLSLDAVPVARLGNVAVVLLYVPDATSPVVTSASTDKRVLGLFIPKTQRTSNAPAFLDRLRQFYRAAPISRKARDRIAPALIALLAWSLGWLPSRRAKPSAIARGDVVVAGYFGDVSGIARAGRLTAEALEPWPVTINRHDLSRDPAAHAIVASSAGGLWICHCNPPEALALMLGTTNRYWKDRYRICYLAYELQRLPRSWHSTLRLFHEVWAPSQFVADAVRAAAPDDLIVRVVPHPLSVPVDAPSRAPATDGTFRFLSMFDMRSTAARKNPLGAIKAFQRAFTPETADVHLTVKVVESDTDAEGYAALREVISGWRNISLLSERLSDKSTLDLIGKSDCLVSLHRSEGFGLTIAEAMTVGTPSIVTGWSAPIEFCRGASVEIGYQLVPVHDPSGRYRGQKWADPDLDEAAVAMRRLSLDRELWGTLSAAGPLLARERLSRFPSDAAYGRYVA